MIVKPKNTKTIQSKNKSEIVCKDHLVSGEIFKLLLDDDLDLLVTTPKPEDKDLEKYYKSENYISHTDGGKSIVDFAYKIVRNYTLKQKLKLINSLCPEGNKILDIGCGTGDFLKKCSNNNWKIRGIEPNSKAREISCKKVEGNKNVFFQNIRELEKKNDFSKFDVITMWHVLEHMPNLYETIFDLKRLLNPKGVVIIAVPNFKSYDAFYYKEFWAAYDVPRHLWHFSQKAIKKIFLAQKMKTVKIIPMKFDAYYVSLLSEKNKTQKYNFLKAIWIGMVSNIKAKQNKEYSSLIYIIRNI